MINIEISNLFLKSIPKINKFQSDLLSLIKTLERNALTGKISSLHIAETLFEFIDNTKDELFVLEEKLKENLIKENVKKVFLEINSRAKILVDILVRFLYERSADVNFLSTDRDIINYITEAHSEESFKFIKNRLIEYVKKYSVYDDVLIISPNGDILVNVNDSNNVKSTKDLLVQEAINSKDVIEINRYSDIFKSKKSSLLLAKGIKIGKTNGAVLVMSIKLEDELNRIFEILGEMSRFTYTIVDDKGVVVVSSNQNIRKVGDIATITLDNLPKVTKFNKKDMLIQNCQNQSYESYVNKKWISSVILPSTSISTKSDNEIKIDKFALEKSNILPDSVKEIQEKWDGIEGDLSDVIINGELIASRLKEYVLNPLLDNIRIVSTSIYEVMESAIADIQKTIINSILVDTKFRAKLAINIMDKTLYERANDCRWFALNTTFREKILTAQDSDSLEAINSILKYMGSVYTVYANIFLFDKSGKILAMSNKRDSHFVGQFIEDPAIKMALSNKDTQKYFVTDFSKRKFYDNKETYIYSASILDMKNANMGGVSIVFDSTPQFQKILDDILPKEKDMTTLKGCFALFVDESKKIVSVSGETNLAVGDRLDLGDNFFTKDIDGYSEILDIFGSYYCVGSCISRGYREYKVSDNYKNTIYALVFTKVEMVHKI